MCFPDETSTPSTSMQPESPVVSSSAATFGVKGESMADLLRFCNDNLDDLRPLVLHGPRGYPGLRAVPVLPPAHTDCDSGIAVLEQGGYRPMSGSIATLCRCRPSGDCQAPLRREL